MSRRPQFLSKDDLDLPPTENVEAIAEDLRALQPRRRDIIIPQLLGGLVFLIALNYLYMSFFTAKELIPDYIILNTRIWTGEYGENNEIIWAEALAVKDDYILDVGTSEDIIKRYLANVPTATPELVQTRQPNGPVVYDGTLHGFEMVTPGFVDAHTHLLMGGFGLTSVQLRDAQTKEEFISRIGLFAQHKAKPGNWIMEGNWNHENWGGEMPTHEWIDEISPNNPVWICRLDGHMCLANNVTLHLANVTKDTPDIPGGTIERDSDGNPTGILKDNAMKLVTEVIPSPSEAEEDAALLAAMAYLASNGVTSAHHMSFTWKDLQAFQRIRKGHHLRTRVYFAAPMSNWTELVSLIAETGSGDHWLKLGNLKAFTDGSLGSHTALMFDPYSDAHADKGLAITPEETLYEWILGADRAGLHCSVHAIGDRANNMILNIFEKVSKLNGPRDRRFRIEHAQTLLPEDVRRFRDLGVIASMQPYHCIDDGVWAEKLLGYRRVKQMYPFKDLAVHNVTMAFGSDWFVAPPTPLQGIYAAMTRSTLDGKNPTGWIPEQKISLDEALLAYTVNGAYASFEENVKGKIRQGYLADFVLLDKDLSVIEPHEIWNAKVISTFVGGKPLFDNIKAIPPQ